MIFRSRFITCRRASEKIILLVFCVGPYEDKVKQIETYPVLRCCRMILQEKSTLETNGATDCGSNLPEFTLGVLSLSSKSNGRMELYSISLEKTVLAQDAKADINLLK